MFENYYVPWLKWAQTNLRGKINAQFVSKLFESINTMLDDLRGLQKGDASQYRPFPVFISGRLPPVDIDKLVSDEQAQEGPGY
jgi:hypothetical protein